MSASDHDHEDLHANLINNDGINNESAIEEAEENHDDISYDLSDNQDQGDRNKSSNNQRNRQKIDGETKKLVEKIKSLIIRIHRIETASKKHEAMVNEADLEARQAKEKLILYNPPNDDTHTGLDEDIFTLMMTTPMFSKGWWYGMVTWLLQMSLLSIVFYEICEYKGTPFNVPFQVDLVVRACQVMAIIISVFMSKDMIIAIKEMSMLWITNRESWIKVISFQSDGYVFLPTWKDWVLRIVLPHLLKFTEGALVLLLSFIIIIQQTNAVSIFIDLTVMQLISELDNVAFWLAGHGYVGTNLKRFVMTAKKIRVRDVVPKAFGRPLRPFLLLALLIIMTCAFIPVVIQQMSGAYFRQTYPSCTIDRGKIKLAGDGNCHSALNTLQCGFDAGDCLTFNRAYTNCDVPEPYTVGNGRCDDVNNTPECMHDGGDCCAVKDDPHFGDGTCHGGVFNTRVCSWDNGDCDAFHKKYPDCPSFELNLAVDTTDIDVFVIGDDTCSFVPHYMTEACGYEDGDCKDCIVDNPELLGNDQCDGGMYNTEGCMNDYHDCDDCNDLVEDKSLIGNGFCDGADYISEKCNNDGGDCVDCNVEDPSLIKNGFCDGADYMSEGCDNDGGDCASCNVDNPFLIKNGFCDGAQYMSEGCNNDGGDCDDCEVDDESLLGNGFCNGGQYNNEECGWDGGDCVECNAMVGDIQRLWLGDGKCDFGVGGKLLDPLCNFDGGDCDGCEVKFPNFLGDGKCDGNEYNTKECRYDNGDCLNDEANYPNCVVKTPSLVGNGRCDGWPYNSAECGFDDGDCVEFNEKYPYCTEVPNPWRIGDGHCDGSVYNIHECGFDGGDCIERNNKMEEKYPNCNVLGDFGYSIIGYFGDGLCHGHFNNEECGYDDGNCLEFNEKYPDCKDIENPWRVGDGTCHRPNNKVECDWDGGDCIETNTVTKEKYPNCAYLDRPIYMELIGSGQCVSDLNIEDCGFDDGDCDEYNSKYPNCTSTFPNSVGDTFCDNYESALNSPLFDNNVKECGWDGGDCDEFNQEARSNNPDFFDKYPDCPPHSIENSTWAGDGYYCDPIYNTEECGFDGGDCFSNNTSLQTDYPKCTQVQYSPWYNDGVCDYQLNTEECGFDGGDCE